nr:unnamed protein product [Spirometra erinaceieuropaei]
MTWHDPASIDLDACGEKEKGYSGKLIVCGGGVGGGGGGVGGGGGGDGGGGGGGGGGGSGGGGGDQLPNTLEGEISRQRGLNLSAHPR